MAMLVERCAAKFGRDMDGEVGRSLVAKLLERCVAKFGREIVG